MRAFLRSTAAHLRSPGLRERALSGAIIGLTSVIGVVAFLYPFWLPEVAAANSAGMAHAGDAPALLTALVGLSFLALLLEAQRAAEHALLVALLGILVAMNSILRFIDVALPLPGGFSPIFVLIILTGYLFGGAFGFLMGAMTLIASALITGGVGPWLPYQMLTAGWVGLSAPLCRVAVRAVTRINPSHGVTALKRVAGGGGQSSMTPAPRHPPPQPVEATPGTAQARYLPQAMPGGSHSRAEIIVLTLFGAFWGFAYGAIMNLWSWPISGGPVEQSYQLGIGLAETLRRYLTFYLITSVGWDLAGSVGNALLIGAFGGAILKALRRFERRFFFVVRPEAEVRR